MPTIILIVGLLLAGGLVAFGIISSRNQPSVVQERLGRYTDVGKAAAPTPSATSTKPRQSPLGERLNEALRGQSFFSKFQTNLNAADLKINVVNSSRRFC